MNQEKQPEALRLADLLEYISNNSEDSWQAFDEAAAELRRLHAQNTEQRAELVAEAARTAEEKLRADQMTEQHRMQSNIRADVEAERDRFRAAYNEWHDKTEWVQETARPKELGMHRADVLRERIANLEAQLSAIGAGGVESLRKSGTARGQSGFEAWWRDKYPSFAMHAPDVWEAAMHHATQPARESLQQSAQDAIDRDTHFYLAGWNGAEREVEANAHFNAALQAAPPAPAAVAVPQVYTAQPLKNEAQGFICDMALEYGAELLNDEGTIYSFNQEQMIAFTEANRSAPAQEHATQGQTFAQWWDAQRKAAAERAPGDDWMDLSADDREQYEAAFNAGARSATQEPATQLAGQGQDDLRFDALQDSAYAAGMLTGWNLCIAGDEATFAKQRGDRMTGAIRALKEANAATPAQAQEDAQIAKLTTAYTELSNMFLDQIVAQQAAWIEWQHGEGAEAAMGWIENGLCGPGHIPDEDAPYGKEAQAWYDANNSDPFPVCQCGRPSNIMWMGAGFCCKAHHDAARAAQGGAA